MVLCTNHRWLLRSLVLLVQIKITVVMVKKSFHGLLAGMVIITFTGCAAHASKQGAEGNYSKGRLKPAIWINPDDKSKSLIIGTDTGANEDHLSYLGTKTPYISPRVSYTLPPVGYQPVFVNHVGRHGARFLTKAGADQDVMKVLEAAEKRGVLTPMGVQVKIIASRLQAAGKGKYESITLLGSEEQAAIGKRVREMYAPAFTGRGLEVLTTWKQRTQQSAEGFLKGFGAYSGPVKNERAPDSTDTNLRFYDLSPAYSKYKKGMVIKHCMDSVDKDSRTAAVARRICARLFTADYTRELMAGPEGEKFADDLYDLYSIGWAMSGELRAAGHPDDVKALGDAFDKEGLAWMDFRSGAADFLEKGPGFDSMGIQVKVAVPLLVDFITTMDRGVKGGQDGVFRFTHAEAIAPFATLLGIQGASTPVRSVYQYHDQWQAERIIPLSANIQWVFYSDGRGGELVKVLLNEREVKLPVATRQWPYYRWEDLRAYYIQKLNGLHTGLQENMQEYLSRLE